MFRTLLTGVAISSLLVLGFATRAHAQTSDETKRAGQEAKQAGKDAGEAGKDAGKATTDAAKATGQATKKTGQVTTDAAKETATGTKKAAKTTAKKLTPETTSASCQDGTVQTGKTKTTACVDHGGVKN